MTSSSCSRGPRPLAAAAAAALLASAACYAYAPVQGAPPVGSDVRAAVTDEGALMISDQTGSLARTVEGRFEGFAGDSLHISVASFRAVSEISGTRQLRQSVIVPRAEVEELRTRHLSAWRSGLAGLAAAAAVYFAVDRVLVGGTNDDADDNDQTTSSLVPLIRIPLGR